MKKLAFLSTALLAALCVSAAWAQQSYSIAPGEFDSLHAKIKPQKGESRFWEIDWMLDLTAARQKAAAEGKPLLVWSGAGGAPIGAC